MSFLHPAMLAAGLACVSLPIIIHLLFRRRRKPIRWGAMRFLLEAYRRQRRRLRLEQILLLAARCLLIALIAVGLGRPLLQRAGLLGGGSVTLYVLIDNSISASATDEDGDTALERHKDAGLGLLATLDPSSGDRAGLIALGGPADPVVLPSSAETEAVSRALSLIEPTASAMDLDGALSRLASELESREPGDGPVRIVVLSDFLAGAADTERTLASLEGVEDIAMLASTPAREGVDNVAIVALEPMRPVLVAGEEEIVKQQQVIVHLRRSGPGVSQAGVTRVRILQERAGVDGGAAVIGEDSVSWTPGLQQTSLPISVSVVGGAADGVLTASIDRDAIEADNQFRRPIEVRPRLRVGIAARRSLGVGADAVPIDAADWISMALAPEGDDVRGDIDVTRVEPAALDAGRLSGLDALVLIDPDALDQQGWQRVATFSNRGGLVVVFPPADATTHAWTDRMTSSFGLDWTIEREAATVDEGVHIIDEREPLGEIADVLEIVSGELEQLTRPVTIWRHLVMRAGPEHGASILTLDDGSPFALAASPSDEQRGLIVMFAVAPSFGWTDLPARPLIVPLMQEVIRQGIGAALGPSWGIAGRGVSAPARATELVSADEGRTRRINVDDGKLAEPIRHAGLWQANDDRGVDRGLLAVNADVDASVADAQSPGEVGAWLGRATPQAGLTWLDPADDAPGAEGGVAESLGLSEASSGLAAKFLLAALVIGLAEVVMARLFSHARAGKEAGQ